MRLTEISAYLTRRRPLSPVVEQQFHARTIGRLALARAVEDHVLHGLAAQVLRRGLAQHPAHGVDDVRLAAAVRADHADKLSRHRNVGGIDEGFEAGELDVGKAQFAT